MRPAIVSTTGRDFNQGRVPPQGVRESIFTDHEGRRNQRAL